MKPFHSVLFLFLFSSAATLAAQSPVAIRAEIVVTASASTETVEETTATATIVTREEIDRRSERDLGAVLQTVPGLTLIRSGSEGKQASLFTRGAGSNQTLVLWNGVELNNPYFAGFDWGQFSTAGVEKVEVVRGPFSALYGSDAVAGVVQVFSGRSSNDLRLDLLAGENGFRQAIADGAFNQGAFSGSVAVHQRRDDGFLPNDDFRQEGLVGQLRWNGSAGSTAALQLRLNDFDLGIALNPDATGTQLVSAPRRRQEGSSRQIALPVSQRIGRTIVDLTVSEDRADDHFSDPDDPFGFTFSTTESVSRRARVVTRTGSRIGTIALGGEFERSEVDSESTFGIDLDGERRSSRAFFVEDRLSFELRGGSTLEVNAGLRHDHFDTFGSQLSPRLGLSWRQSGHKFRAAYGGAFRAPSIGELYFPFYGNRHLEPERSRSVEAGYERFIDPRSAVSVTLFHNDYDNLIVFDVAGFAFGNIGAARSQGIELGGATGIGPLSIRGSWMWLDTEERATGESLVRRPRNSGSLVFGFNAARITTALSLIHTGARADVQPIAPYGVVRNQAATTADLAFHYRAGNRLVPYLRIENLSDERYEAVLGYPSPPRRVLIGIRYAVQ